MNPVAIVASVIVGAVVLFVYYSPPVLGPRWAAAVIGWTGQSQAELASDQPRRLAMWLIAAAVNAVVLAWLLDRLAVTTLQDGLLTAAAVWLGFGATFSAWPAIFANQPWTIWAINNGAYLLIQLLAAAIVVQLG